uniref:NADH-ubiquinone oxidoreductase chain 6 n=1 Tax=Eucryptorrhynchus scrobiculatus TaxID=1552824 RepID=A0A410PAC8_EUCSC|nr:NADH dehydrogenase subunit 6 [Eucryptorrhynchus scrobiculatus]UFP90428.1 NADH dehydrogenase subunit 6 [Eucryptorrhynchus scrobiculatus]
MLMKLFMFNLLLSFIFMFLSHPLSLGGILLIQTIVMTMMSSFMFFNFWFSYILFLVMIGGMLVMFIYMTSIASNEKFKLPKNMMLYTMIFMIPVFLTMLFVDEFYSSIISLKFNSLNQSFLMLNMNLSKFFNHPNMKILMFLMIYLLITLIAVVKIIGKNFGSLRQK